jgi:ketosteroid isomerase-like protein
VPSTDSEAGAVLRRWFEAHREGDLAAARALMRPDAEIRVPGGVVTGFDGLMEWYAERSARLGADFRYEAVDLLTGTDHVAAVLRLTDGTRTWQQVALYRVVDGVIAAVSAYED